MNKAPRFFAAVFFGWLLAATSAQAQQATAPQGLDQIAAIVNDDVITLNELHTRMKTVERQLRQQGTALPPRNVIERQLLERMIADRLQLQLAREAGLRVGETELDGAVARIAAGNKMEVAAFKNALQKDGVDWARFREEIRDEITISRMREREVDSRINISDGEVDNFLANQKDDDEVVNLAHIILRVPEQAASAEVERIRARAAEALRHLRAGDDFAKVAAAYSNAPDALTGGAMGERPLNRLPTLYADAARDMRPGGVSEILRSPAGFHLIKLIARSGAAKEAKPLPQTRARHILIKTNELVTDDEAQRRLLDLRQRLANGADFADLARQYSNDLSAANGGELGWLNAGDTVPEFERAMDALKLNEISPPVKSAFGWHLIQVEERRSNEASPERRRQAARQALRERKLDEAYEDWLRQLRDRAYVEVREQESGIRNQ